MVVYGDGFFHGVSFRLSGISLKVSIMGSPDFC